MTKGLKLPADKVAFELRRKETWKDSGHDNGKSPDAGPGRAVNPSRRSSRTSPPAREPRSFRHRQRWLALWMFLPIVVHSVPHGLLCSRATVATGRDDSTTLFAVSRSLGRGGRYEAAGRLAHPRAGRASAPCRCTIG
jgi:hypothetical protein